MGPLSTARVPMAFFRFIPPTVARSSLYRNLRRHLLPARILRRRRPTQGRLSGRAFLPFFSQQAPSCFTQCTSRGSTYYDTEKEATILPACVASRRDLSKDNDRARAAAGCRVATFAMNTAPSGHKFAQGRFAVAHAPCVSPVPQRTSAMSCGKRVACSGYKANTWRR